MVGCTGPALTGAEAALFAEADPFGFILFGRNCDTPDQVRDLVAALRTAVGRADAPILIDQEGGRVARLGPPHWPCLPAVRGLGALAERDAAVGRRAAWLHGRLTAAMLAPLGITVACAPVCDVPRPDADPVIGDRAPGTDPLLVGQIAGAIADGLVAGGVLPVIKHIPGHGRARADSHVARPQVTDSRDELARSDFLPFRVLADRPLAMVAHVVFTAYDAAAPASVSATVIADAIRCDIGFDGLLISDDLAMGALDGAAADRAAACLAAGCDVALYCSGDPADTAAIAARVPLLSDASLTRWQRAQSWVKRIEPDDVARLTREFETLMTARPDP